MIVTFRYKDYRRNGQARYCTMTLSADEFIRRFLLHVLFAAHLAPLKRKKWFVYAKPPRSSRETMRLFAMATRWV
jgi:hypothetical protein